ncbi:MAG: TAT-variant-translocated molybdopterin oxidoreductase [Flavobacteriales bacterium]|nr:TAT-variant-translocated molybdopterin oxidoreductase [Flavobacteriales bacterium]
MSAENKYWRGVEELQEDPQFLENAQNEFPEQIPVDEFLADSKLSETSTSRRDFLKFLGFSTAAATLAACETPVTKAIPYVVKPEEITPGVANYYASTYADGNDYASILVKTREGRPIHIEGNTLSKVTGGAVNANVNSSVLSLYDGTRIQSPFIGQTASSWDVVDGEITKKLEGIKSRGGNIRILTNSIISPSTKSVISKFISAYGSGATEAEGSDVAQKAANVKHITYDAVSNAGIINANRADFGKAVLPTYDFTKAKTIVSIGADFLSTWLSSIEYAGQYASRRNPDGDWMSKHYQFEANMSMTGTNADIRGAIKPSEFGKVALHLYNAVAKQVGGASVSVGEIDNDNGIVEKITAAASDLIANKGNGLVICGSNDQAIQSVVNAINTLLGNYGSTVNVDTVSNLKQANDTDVYSLINEMKSGKVDALIIWGINPSYSMPADWKFDESLAKVNLSVTLTGKPNETAQNCGYVCPDSHYLESWNDASPRNGEYSLAQPVISNLFDTRQGASSLMKWAGLGDDYNQFIKDYWKENMFPSSGQILFSSFWNKVLQDGVYSMTAETVTTIEASTENEDVIVADGDYNGDVKAAASTIGQVTGGAWEMSIYSKTGIGDGQQLRNPWLHETPDPVTKVVWDNYICMNPVDMDEFGFNTSIQQQKPANIATVTANGADLTLPVVAVPGQKRKTISVALGYGQAGVAVDGVQIGQNAYPMTSYTNGTINYNAFDVSIAGTGETYPLACTQTHHTMMGRKMVNETDLNSYKTKGREVWNPKGEILDAYGKVQPFEELNLWNDHDIKKGHRWGMTIDLNTCTGCSACVTACYSENNVPVVGRDEVRRNREMNWIRIDRYYSSDADPLTHSRDKGDRDYNAMEDPSAYPTRIVHQPVMCQHCNHAPCETVCPVAATTHSNEGLNQMAYNRCIGTRYCMNNCPYKVRRFNWFNYNKDSKFSDISITQDDLGRMVLNPDVVVRSRGVMEKCSMCVQRVQAGKLVAKKNGKPVVDGDIKTACASACPTNAITFGDHNDVDAEVRKRSQTDRAYHLLEDVGTQPNIWYLTKVKNSEEMRHVAVEHGSHQEEEGHGHDHEEKTEEHS